MRFREVKSTDEGTPVTAGLTLRFRPVMTRHCGKDYEGDEPPLTDFPIQNTRPYVPRWLRIDHHKGQWLSEFDYLSQTLEQSPCHPHI